MKLVYLTLVFAAGYILLPLSVKQRDLASSKPQPVETEQGPVSPQGNTVDELGIETVDVVHSESAHGDEEHGTESLTQIAVIERSPAEASFSVKPQASATKTGVPALIDHLVRSIEEMEKIPGYTVTLEQQVQKRGRLLDPEWIDVKLRRSPFSVYLKWQEDNQEVVYMEGRNDGRLLVHPTKGLASLRSIWRIRPDSPQAMKDCRYPLTELGIEKLSRMALNFYEQETNTLQDVVCISSPALADGRPATAFEVRFVNQSASPQYATSKLTFDHENGLLVSLESHAWGQDGKPGPLLERYRYHSMTPHAELSDADFSETNPEYHFQK